MESLTQVQPAITLTITTGSASDILSGLNLLSRIRSGESAERCRRLHDHIWIQAFHDLSRKKAA